jgi:putative transposase
MKANQAGHSIATMCRVLGVSASGYYAWTTRTPSLRAAADAVLLEDIRMFHRRSRGTYGAPRLHRDLRAAGRHVSRKRVARLLKQAGLHGVSRRKWPVTTHRAVDTRPAPDLVQRTFAATAPNQLWVADITYIPTWAGLLYLAVVLDVWSRRIVGWAMETHLRTSLVLAALDMAIVQRQPHSVIHHSDQGSQYTAVGFGLRCQAAGVRPSMGSVGDCYDNAMCESFFATLECELLDRIVLRTPQEARTAVFDFIEGWYNSRRRHSALDYESPLTFERQHRAAQTPRLMTPMCNGQRPMEAAGAVDAQNSAHRSLENPQAGFPQRPQDITIVMTEQQNSQR